MALNNKKNFSTMGLKATFFDLFRDHTNDVVKMIESLANGQTEDVVNVETSIFQRIIMLNKTANSIDGLAENVEMLNTLKTNDNLVKSNETVKDTTPVKSVSSDSKIVATPAKNPSVDSAHPTPEVAVTSTPVTSSNPPSQITSQVNPSPAQNISQVSTPEKDFSSPQTNVLVPKVENSVQGNGAVNNSGTNVFNAPISPETDTSVVENQGSKEPIQFVKQSDKKAKAILVNTKQFGKLMASRQRQFGFLDFGAYPKEDVSSKIENLMKKASALYKEGKVSEAQAMYAEISALNKQLNQEQGRDKVLMKRAA